MVDEPNTARQVGAFLHDLGPGAVPAEVRSAVRRHVLDTLATGAGGAMTEAAAALCGYASQTYGETAHGARVLFSGRRFPAPVAAALGAGSVDALDAHDGHALAKGHAGCAVVPAALAFADAAPDGGNLDTLLTTILVGYEIALRAGIALHRIAPAYHTSGAWNALGAAAVGARHLGLTAEQTEAALGLAEFDAPRGLMMRVIDRPSMVKDGSRAGVHAGVAAAYAARTGFTATPAELLGSADAADLWADLGTRWRTTEQYIKPFPVCRWTQPALSAAAALRPQIGQATIARVEVASFEPAVRLGGDRPESPDAAQYALIFPLAAYLARGRLGAAELSGKALADPAIRALAERIVPVVAPDLDARFPAERWARLTVTLADGRILESGARQAHGDPDRPLSEPELRAKVEGIAEALPARRLARLVAMLLEGSGEAPAARLLDTVLAPAADAATRSPCST